MRYREIGGTSMKVWSLIMIGLIAIAPALAQNNTLSLGRSFRPDPAKLEGTTGGNVSIANLAGIEAKCRGFASNQPNHVINLTASFPILDLLVTSGNNDDTTMLIKGPNGLVICADDEYQGRSPQVTRRLPQGSYQIWVGSSEPNKSAKYTLSLSEIQQK
jgi:hypothetical protein